LGFFTVYIKIQAWKLLGRFVTPWKAVGTVLKRKRDQGIGRLVTAILPFSRQIVQSIHKEDARLLLLRDLQKIVGDIHSSACSPDEIIEPIHPEVKAGILLSPSRWALRSLMKLDFQINGKYPRYLKVLHSAHRSASDIHSNLKKHNKGICQD